MSLRISIGDYIAGQAIVNARGDRIPPEDVNFAMISDVHPNDVGVFRLASRRYGMIIIIRCPKKNSVGFHGLIQPKASKHGVDSQGNWIKSGLSGLGVHPETGDIFVSDYDMMSLWRREEGRGFIKVPAKNIDDAGFIQPFAQWINGELRSPLQHGAQDDYVPPPGKKHPNVAEDCACAAFELGRAIHLTNRRAIKEYYARNKLVPWPYDDNGVFIRPENR